MYPPLANGGFNTGALQNLNLQHRAERAGGDHARAPSILNLPSNATVADGGAVRSDQSGYLQPVDLDHGLRLARQFVSGHVLLHADGDARRSGPSNMTVNGTVGRRGRKL